MDLFEKGLKIDVSKHIEKKGQFSYLSWPFAVAELRKLDPEATWIVEGDGMPYAQTPAGCFVKVKVILSNGKGYSQIHPVLDNRNRPIEKPNAFDINTSIQRCLVKAIALATGIGLHIYAGEDLPTDAIDNVKEVFKGAETVDLKSYEEQLKATKDLDELKKVWSEGKVLRGTLSQQDNDHLTEIKDIQKMELTYG